VSEPIQELKAEFFKALGHPARIRVLELLAEREWSVSELIETVGLEGSHLSQQLGVLRRANLIRARKEGTSVYYSITDRRIVKILQLSKEVLVGYLTRTRDLLTEAGR